MPELKESALQIAFANYMRYALPHVLVAHVKNEGYANETMGYQMKLRGVLAGFHDNILLWAPRNMATIELKRPGTKAKYSEKQQGFAERLDKIGFPHACCSSGEEIVAALKRFGLNPVGEFPLVLEKTKKQAMQNSYHAMMLEIANDTKNKS